MMVDMLIPTSSCDLYTFDYKKKIVSEKFKVRRDYIKRKSNVLLLKYCTVCAVTTTMGTYNRRPNKIIAEVKGIF